MILSKTKRRDKLCVVFGMKDYTYIIFPLENLWSCSIAPWGPSTTILIMYFGDYIHMCVIIYICVCH